MFAVRNMCDRYCGLVLLLLRTGEWLQVATNAVDSAHSTLFQFRKLDTAGSHLQMRLWI